MFDEGGIVFEGGQGLGVIALQGLEVFPLFPPDVVVQQDADASNEGGIGRDGCGIVLALVGEVAEGAVLVQQSLAHFG